MIHQRPAFYCWLDSVSTSEPILGAYEYQRWIEGGASKYLVFNTNNEIYYSWPYPSNTNTSITPNIDALSDDGIPVWFTYYNDLFMANGENSPIQWDQDGNCLELGRCVFSGSVTFEDNNEIVATTDFESGNYHFRPGWDLIITDTNNNGTYEIYSVDSNVIVVTTTAGVAVDWTIDQTDAASTLTGIGAPSILSTSRAETITYTKDTLSFLNNDTTFQGFLGSTFDGISMRNTEMFYEIGFRVGMSLTISNATGYDGTYTIVYIINASTRNYILLANTAWGTASSTVSNAVLAGSQTVATADAFNAATITGHKSRLFAGGVKEYPTYLFYSISRLLDVQGTFYYDMWRDRFGYTDGSGYFDLQDKITALVGEWNGMLIVFCEGSIFKIIGDDPGFDILTPSQAIVYQPVPISKRIGCIGPNAWCEIGNDIFFMSKDGLQQLSVAQGGDLPKATVKSLPVSDIVDAVLKGSSIRKIDMKFLSDLNLLLIMCGTIDDTDNIILAYNIANESWSKWSFSATSSPRCLFNARGPLIDPNETSWPNDDPNPYETVWYGSEDGKLYALTKAYCYDRDYEDPNDETNTNYGMTAISSKLNFGEPFLDKNFRRAVVMASPQVNYSTASGGAVSLYFKVDDNSWSSAVSKSFTTHSDTAGTAIDYYEYLDAGVSLGSLNPTIGKTIQLKLYTSGTTSRWGLAFMSSMIEWTQVRY